MISNLQFIPAYRQPHPLADAAFCYSITPDKVIVIIDKDLTGHRSVTNDIENVLSDIAQQETLESLAGYQVLYCDSTSRWDEALLSATGRFHRFAPNGGTNEQHALTLLRAARGRNYK